MSRRFFAPLVALVIASLGIMPVSAAARVSSGVPGKFAPCMDGGWQGLFRSNGTSFANLGACISYAVRGGALLRTIDASSVYTPERGFGTPLSAPDANGDSFGSFGDSGVITGGFSFPPTCANNPPITFCINFGMTFLGYVLHTSTGVAQGNGTALCDPCWVGGHAGIVNFAATLVGHAVTLSDGSVGVSFDPGTWQITSATGGLAAISGSGHWIEQSDGTRDFTGSIVAPV
jgi:hypothetical protein